jgi:hypothetical protein
MSRYEARWPASGHPQVGVRGVPLAPSPNGALPPQPEPREVTLHVEPEVISEEIQPDGSTLVTYDDGTVWRVSRRFSPATERVETYWERLESTAEDR